jgi:hypothetical protein
MSARDGARSGEEEMRKIVGLAGLAALMMGVCVAQSAFAQDTTTEQDLRCFVIGVEMGNSADSATARAAGFSAALYFLGRLDGRAPGLDLERALADLPTLSQGESRSEAQRCGQALIDRGREIEDIGRALDQP